MSVLLVTAHMLTPIASVEPIHLDALLVAASTGRHLSRRDALLELPALPLVHLDMHGERVYLCSAWQFPDGASQGRDLVARNGRMRYAVRQGRDYITKRRDGEDIAWLSQSFTPSAGPGKNYQLPVLTVEAATVSWLCVGSRRGIKGLLRYVGAIGTKRRMGYGAVQRWTVEYGHELALEPRASDVLVGGGLAERFLPRSWLKDAPTVERGPVCPPYWHPARVTQRVRPGWRCELRSDVARAVEGTC